MRNEGRRIRQAFIAPEDISSCLRTIHRLSLLLWRIFPVIKDCSRRSPKGRIFTAQRRRKCWHWIVTGEQRRSAKAINFGLIYGMSAASVFLASLIFRVRGAEVYGSLHFERYGVLEYMERTRAQARTRLCGNAGGTPPLPDIKSATRRGGAQGRAARRSVTMQERLPISSKRHDCRRYWLQAEQYACG